MKLFATFCGGGAVFDQAFPMLAYASMILRASLPFWRDGRERYLIKMDDDLVDERDEVF